MERIKRIKSFIEKKVEELENELSLYFADGASRVYADILAFLDDTMDEDVDIPGLISYIKRREAEDKGEMKALETVKQFAMKITRENE